MANDPGIKTSVTVTGTKKVVTALEAADARIKQAAMRIIRKYAIKIERSAKLRAPVDEGRLRSNIHHRLGDLAAEVLTDITNPPYPWFQEFGTGRRGRASGIDPPEGYSYGHVAGISPNSFLRPALEEHRAQFIRDLKTEIRKASGGGFL